MKAEDAAGVIKAYIDIYKFENISGALLKEALHRAITALDKECENNAKVDGKILDTYTVIERPNSRIDTINAFKVNAPAPISKAISDYFITIRTKRQKKEGNHEPKKLP